MITDRTADRLTRELAEMADAQYRLGLIDKPTLRKHKRRVLAKADQKGDK